MIKKTRLLFFVVFFFTRIIILFVVSDSHLFVLCKPHYVSLSQRIPSCLQASQPDELTIEEQEILEVIDDGDMEDWVKVGFTSKLKVFLLLGGVGKILTVSDVSRPGQEPQRSGRLCPREIPSAAFLQQPPQHAAGSGGSRRPLALFQQLHWTWNWASHQLC